MGNASTAMIAERIPPCPTSHVVETLVGGERRNNAGFERSRTDLRQLATTLRSRTVSIRRATQGDARLALGSPPEWLLGLLPACCPFGYQE